MFGSLLFALVIVLLVGVFNNNTRERDFEETVILISIDGYRSDYLQRGVSPQLGSLAEQGVRAEALIPVHPTKTFPNHYSIVTGLYSANHGIVSNTIYDPVFDETFQMSKREEVENPRWWLGEPIWVTAEKQGVTAASFFWPGSEAPIKGIQPTYWKRYNGSIPGKVRVDHVLGWLDMKKEDRPRFITLYFSEVDSKGHQYGPDSEEVLKAMKNVDAHLGRLLRGIKKRGLDEYVNIIVVSDHGMAATDSEKLIFLDDYITVDSVQLIETSPVAMMNGMNGNAAAIYKALHNAHPALNVYSASDYPADWQWTGNRRIPQLAAVADEGWTIVPRRLTSGEKPFRISQGAHGYDRRLESMGALFVAQGPAFKEGAVVEAFESIHIYELIAHLLSLEPAENDGSLEAVRHVLK